jgi:hypothetical protein
MVGVDDEVSPLQIHTPFAEGMHDGEGFFLMSSIVKFVDIHLAGCKSNRLGSLALVLHEYSSNSKVRSIGGYCKWEFRVRDTEYRSFSHTLLEFLKRFGSARSPKKRDIFVGEIGQGCSNLGVAFDEPSVVVAET